jgi:heme O synthase-like polyprenyltransferase
MQTFHLLFIIGMALIAIFSAIRYFKNTPKKPNSTKIHKFTIFVLIIFISISAITFFILNP